MKIESNRIRYYGYFLFYRFKDLTYLKKRSGIGLGECAEKVINYLSLKNLK